MGKELSEVKQGMLIAMYLNGVREIRIQTDNLLQINKPDFFGKICYGGNIPFLIPELSLKELEEDELSTGSKNFILADLIKKYCPKYSHVLYMINDTTGRF